MSALAPLLGEKQTSGGRLAATDFMSTHPSCSFESKEGQLAAASRTRRHARDAPWERSCCEPDESISPRRHSRIT